MMTENEARARAEVLRSEGWHILPCEYPEKALGGLVAVRGIEEEILGWPLFGDCAYATETELVDAATLLDFARQPGALQCDDPRKRLLGFVQYDHGRRVAVLKQTTLTGLRESNPDIREAVLGLRKEARMPSVSG